MCVSRDTHSQAGDDFGVSWVIYTCSNLSKFGTFMKLSFLQSVVNFDQRNETKKNSA